MRPHRRAGLSLTEVLVAMFVMALGLMALLTLFPLGAMQVAQALKDDRTAQTASQADSWVRVWWRDAVPPNATDSRDPAADPALNALDDPNLLARVRTNVSGVFNNGYAGPTYLLPAGLVIPPASSPINTRLDANDLTGDTNVPPNGTTLPTQTDTAFLQLRYAQRPSDTKTAGYPMLLDSLGFTATRSGGGAVDRFWVGRNGGTVYGAGTVPLLIPRRNPTATGGSQLPLPSAAPTAAYTACALTDDLTFQANGGAGNNSEQLGRQGRYHWAAMIQRTDNSKPDVAELTVLVFDGRPPFLGITGDEVVLTNNFVNTLDPNAFNPPPGGPDGVVQAGDRSLRLHVPARGADQPALVRRGGWVMLVSLTNGVRAVGFHRVTGLTTDTDIVIGGTTSVTPMALDIDPPAKFGAGPGQLQVYLLAGLSEVFDRPPLTR